MKKVLAIIIYIAFALSAFSQNSTYTVKVNNQPLIEVLKKVEKKYDLFFSYKVKDVKKVIVSLSTQTTSINNLLQQLLADTNLQFEIVDSNFVVIKQKQALKLNTVCGTVYDFKSRTPLPYANVLVQNTTTGTITDEDGNFELKYQSNADKKLRISYVGYEAQTIESSKFEKKNCPAILLKMPKIKEAFLIIKDYLTDGISVENNGAATNIKPQLIGNMPGVIEPDILSTIQFLPGVASPTSRASDIYIRGCTPDQNLIIWEDIPVYHTVHYFGMISSINPYIIENTNVYRGGFNATYGGRIGGVIELESPNETTYKSNFGIGTNMTHAQAYANQKFKLANKPAVIIFSVRRSFNEFFETPTFKAYSSLSQQGLVYDKNNADSELDDKISIINDFNFLDGQVKFSSQINEKNKFQLAGILATNTFNDSIIYKNQSQTDSLFLTSNGLSAKWQHQWNNKLATVAKVINTNYSLTYDYKVINRRKIFLTRENTIKDKQLVIHNNYKGSKGQNWQLGYHLTNYNITYKGIEFNRRKDDEDDWNDTSNLHAVYLHYQNPIENKIGIAAGVRGSYYSNSKEKIKIEPRLRIDYKLSKLLSLHSSYGLYHQVLGQVEVFKGDNLGFQTSHWELFGGGKENLKVQKSEMFQAGLIFQAKDWVIDLQAYRRKVNGISSRAYSIETISANQPEDGKSNIIGIDLLVKKRFGNFRTWLSYSLSKSDLTFKIDSLNRNSTFPSNYDQRHILDWSNQLRLNNWHFSAGVKLSSGLPYTEMTGFEYLPRNLEVAPADQPNYKGIYGPINARNLPFNKTVNISANYQLKPLNQKWKAHFTASIINLLNAKNIYERNYALIGNNEDIDEIKPIDKTNLPFTPNISVRFKW